jgi:HEAT repeat protein
MQQTARQLVAEIPGAPMTKRLETGRRLTAMGEPGTSVLIESLRHPDPAVRAFAAWTLGHASDLRALPGLRAATADPAKLVSLEAAAARVRLGDDAGIVRIVEGLDDPDPRVRARCIGILESRIGDTFGYLPDDSPSERAAAVERWRVFLRQRGLETPR